MHCSEIAARRGHLLSPRFFQPDLITRWGCEVMMCCTAVVFRVLDHQMVTRSPSEALLTEDAWADPDFPLSTPVPRGGEEDAGESETPECAGAPENRRSWLTDPGCRKSRCLHGTSGTTPRCTPTVLRASAVQLRTALVSWRDGGFCGCRYGISCLSGMSDPRLTSPNGESESFFLVSHRLSVPPSRAFQSISL